MPALFAKPKHNNLIFIFLILQLFLIYTKQVNGQQNVSFQTTNKLPTTRFSSKVGSDLFSINKCFIKNVGQYNDSNAAYKKMGMVHYGFEAFNMPVLFTDKGLVYLQRKLKNTPIKEKKERERETAEEEIEKRSYIFRYITMEWLNANPHPIIETENELKAYHTYGLIKEKAKTFKKLIYKDVYHGIDIVYSLKEDSSLGFEYSIIVKPGADLNQVHFKYGGDVHSIKKDKSGNLVISSDIDGIKETVPVCFYQENEGSAFIKKDTSLPNLTIQLTNKENEIHFTGNYDHHRILIIDPFVSNTNNLTGINAGKAADIDFDFEGNIFIAGGGDQDIQQLAKFDANGMLQWTFSGTIANWNFGSLRGGWIVEKSTGKVYLAQGFAFDGYQVIRLDPAGIYDNYISDANPDFEEAWKLYWTCNNGISQILIAGGGTNSSNNFGILNPPDVSITGLNITGLPGFYQDIADIVIDPVTNDMFTLFPNSSNGTMFVEMLYKNFAPYNSSSIVWKLPTGFNNMSEANNRPYLGSFADNSVNILAINNSYLFYWNGKNLKAFDKATGAGVGTLITTGNTALMQGGIIADNCNNIFVGDANGVIKTYHFDGNKFDDAALPDINIPGFTNKAVYDLAYDEPKKLLYASGDGFIAAFDIASYCSSSSSSYSLNIVKDCKTASSFATLSPAPPSGSTITFELYDGPTQISSNNTGIFHGLQAGKNYNIIATVNNGCNWQQTGSFFILGPIISTGQVNSICNQNVGSISAFPSGATAPYSFSIDGINFQTSNFFNGLAAGNYTITAKDAIGCIGKSSVIITNSNAPIISYSSTDANCGNTGSLTATVNGGTAPFQYSIDGNTFQNSNVFNGLNGGNYTLIVKDANGCSNSIGTTINYISPLSVSLNITNAYCENNGIIYVDVAGGQEPYQYSLDGITWQSDNAFYDLMPGNYTVYSKDANSCTKITNGIIADVQCLNLSLEWTNNNCTNLGSITAIVTGGSGPYLFSIAELSTPLQSSPTFTNLPPGDYTIIVMDNDFNSTSSIITIIPSSPPLLTANTSNASCSSNNGTITATATSGTGPYTYSIDGVNYQAGGVFNNLSSGNYNLTVKDANGCIAAEPISITGTVPPILQITKTDPSCGSSNGLLTASTSGGLSPYQYSIDNVNWSANNTFNNLAGGNYTLIAKDANGCSDQRSITISNTNGPSLNFASSSSSCSPNGGSITAIATNGSGSYSYSIDGINYQAGNVFNNLSSGNYTLSTKDANGCIASTLVTITGSVPPTLQITKSDPACGTNNGIITATATGGLSPYQYSIDNINWSANNSFNNLAGGNYTVSIKDAGGCSSTQSIQLANNNNNINLNSGGDLNICLGTSTVLAATSNGTSFSWAPSTGLSNSTILNPVASPSTSTKYYITVSDGLCSRQDSVTVNVNPSPIANAGPDKTVCFEENTQLEGTGGGSYNWTPTTYLVNNKTANPMVEKPGSTTTYNLTVVNDFGCQSTNLASTTINVLPEAKVFAGDDLVVFKNQSVQLHAKDITNSQFNSFNWSPPSGLDNFTSVNPIAIINKDITYKLTAITKEGCIVTDQVSIKVVEKPEIYVPTGFTPDGDGKDDFLKAFPVGIKEFKYLSVYNRWGQRIFYTTDPAKGWNGEINGEAQKTDVFVWVTEGIDYNGNIIVKKGTTVLIR